MFDDIYKRPVQVVLSCTGEYFSEEEVEYVSIQEDMEGKDLLTFICPKCLDTHESYRLL